MNSSGTSSRRHVILVLPFTSAIYLDPSSLLPAIHHALISTASTSASFTVLFSTPTSPCPPPGAMLGSAPAFSQVSPVPEKQLYARLRRNVRANFAGLQAFLGKVYACLAAAQWAAGKVLMDVEVRFEGETEADLRDRPTNEDPDTSVFVLDGYSDLPVSLSAEALSRATLIPSPALPSLGSFALQQPSPGPAVVALGGTFDHLHAAHKLLIHLGYFLATRKLIVGVTADRLLGSKQHTELVQPLEDRIAGVEGFLRRRGTSKQPSQLKGSDHRPAGGGSKDQPEPGDPSMRLERDLIDDNALTPLTWATMDVVEIQDPYGPTAWDPDIQALLVSRETSSGGAAVRSLRREKGLPEIEVFTIDVISADIIDANAEGDDGGTKDLSELVDEGVLKEVKMGSTGIRQWISEHMEW